MLLTAVNVFADLAKLSGIVRDISALHANARQSSSP